MSITSIVSKLFAARQRELEKHLTKGEELQRAVLRNLTSRARDTEYGRTYAFGEMRSYDDFARRVPVNTYEELKGRIDRMRHGETDVLWPGRVKWYAKSSGTTNDKSKFIPVSHDCLHRNHYAGSQDVVSLYLRNTPGSRLFDGRALILGGSHAPNYDLPGSLVGDLSAILIENINPVVNLVRVPCKQTALLPDFEVKRDRIAHEALNKNVTNISGVPSWMLSVLTRVMEISGKKHLEEVWPNLEVFFHGGVAFTPYREQYANLITSSRMHYMETYNASEGFFAVQDDPADKSMLLLLDRDVFYEFVPSANVLQPGTCAQQPGTCAQQPTPCPSPGEGGLYTSSAENIDSTVENSNKSLDTSVQSNKSLDTSAQSNRILDTSAQSNRILDTSAQSNKSLDTSAQSNRILDTSAQSNKSLDTSAQSNKSLDTSAQSNRILDTSAQSNQSPLPWGGVGGGLSGVAAGCLPLWAVEPGKSYAMIISSSNGLWRYMLGDTVKFTSVNPYKIVITGRTKSFINAFGEELIVDNAEQGLSYACQQTGAQVKEYTAAPVFMDSNARCRHQWLIEFSQPPADIDLFARLLDERLQQVNSDYEAKRYKDITLQPLEIVVARPELFNDWLRLHGKLGGQHKVPRLNNDRGMMEQLLRLNKK